MEDIAAAARRIGHRVRHMIRGGKIKSIDDSGAAQIAQVALSSIEKRDHTPMLTIYGLSSRPPVDSDVVVLFLGGDRSAGVGIASSNQTHRLRDLKDGEIALYDDLKRKLHFTRDGLVIEGKEHDINIKTTKNVVVLVQQEIHMSADGETLRKVVTELFKDIYNTHTHSGGSPPTQQMTDAHLTGAFRAGGPA